MISLSTIYGLLNTATVTQLAVSGICGSCISRQCALWGWQCADLTWGAQPWQQQVPHCWCHTVCSQQDIPAQDPFYAGPAPFAATLPYCRHMQLHVKSKGSAPVCMPPVCMPLEWLPPEGVAVGGSGWRASDTVSPASGAFSAAAQSRLVASDARSLAEMVVPGAGPPAEPQCYNESDDDETTICISGPVHFV